MRAFAAVMSVTLTIVAAVPFAVSGMLVLIDDGARFYKVI